MMDLRFGIDKEKNEIIVCITGSNENEGKAINISLENAKQLRDVVLPQLISILETNFEEIEKLLK